MDDLTRSITNLKRKVIRTGTDYAIYSASKAMFQRKYLDKRDFTRKWREVTEGIRDMFPSADTVTTKGRK